MKDREIYICSHNFRDRYCELKRFSHWIEIAGFFMSNFWKCSWHLCFGKTHLVFYFRRKNLYIWLVFVVTENISGSASCSRRIYARACLKEDYSTGSAEFVWKTVCQTLYRFSFFEAFQIKDMFGFLFNYYISTVDWFSSVLWACPGFKNKQTIFVLITCVVFWTHVVKNIYTTCICNLS